MKETVGIDEDKLFKIVDEIDDVFHKNGYAVSHDEIASFVVNLNERNRIISC